MLNETMSWYISHALPGMQFLKWLLLFAGGQQAAVLEQTLSWGPVPL